jgi:APA family basic amino acid/polyamine antiporter
MALWVGCGLFVLVSLLVVAELIAMTPRSGGIYALVAHAYGPYPGFLIGWTDWVAGCASMALKLVVMLEYVVLLEPRLSAYQTEIAVVISTVFALLQLRGVKVGASIQQFASTVMGLIMMGLAIALYVAFFRNGGTVEVAGVVAPTGAPGVAAFGLVIAAVVFTYDGWYAASYFSEEVKSGGRGVAIASIQAALIVFALYVLLNLALVLSVPLAALIGHDLALAEALDLTYGVGAGTIVIFAAIVILLAHQNLQYMVMSRVIYSLSQDGLGTERATSVNDRGTPAGATVLTWVLTVFLIIVGQFELLLSLVTIFFMAMYVSLVIGVFKLRKQEPDTERPFRAWGFPATGYICAIGWTAVAVFVSVTNPDSALYGAILTAVSIPVFLTLRRYRGLNKTIDSS